MLLSLELELEKEKKKHKKTQAKSSEGFNIYNMDDCEMHFE